MNPWDGTFNGDALPVGSYYYIIQIAASGEASIIIGERFGIIIVTTLLLPHFPYFSFRMMQQSPALPTGCVDHGNVPALELLGGNVNVGVRVIITISLLPHPAISLPDVVVLLPRHASCIPYGLLLVSPPPFLHRVHDRLHAQ